jgi:serine/threonine-protein kinase
MSLEVGQVIENKYRIIRLLGEGGMGAVYEGENIRINRRVAIKILHPAFTSNTDVVQRFEREAQAAGRIGNDHILEVIDLGVLPDGDHFMVMEFLDGESMSDRMRRIGRMTPQELAPLARQLLVGLAAAHAAGIVHRDLKPDNVFVLREKAGVRDYVKIIDFGISKFQPLSGDGMKMTRTGAVMGTPYYMSPEQASGSKEADGRSDIYSVGVILYEAVTGHVPFDAPTFNALMFQIVLSDVVPPQTVVPDLDPAFAAVILKSMTRDVSKRFQSAQEMIDALDAWAHGAGPISVPPGGDLGDLLPNAQGSRERMLSAAGLSSPGTNPGFAPGAPANPTPADWATSQADMKLPTRSVAPLLAALGGLGILVVGGALALRFVLHKPEPSGAGAAAAASSLADPGAPQASVPAPTNAVSAEPSAAPSAPSASASASPEPAPAAPTVRGPLPGKVSSGAAASPAATRPTDKPAGKPAPGKPAAPAGGGLDFGY